MADFVTTVSTYISQRLNLELLGDIEKLEVHPANTNDELRLHITWLNSEFVRQMDSQHNEARTEFVIDTKLTKENDMLFLFIWPCVRSVEQQTLTSAPKERLQQVKYLIDTISDLRPMVPLTPSAQWPPNVSERMRLITHVSVNQNTIVFSAGIPQTIGQAYKKPEGWDSAFDGVCG